MQIICSRKDVDPECSMTDEEFNKYIVEHNEKYRINIIILDDDDVEDPKKISSIKHKKRIIRPPLKFNI